MAGKLSLGLSKWLYIPKTINLISTINLKKISAGVKYHNNPLYFCGSDEEGVLEIGTQEGIEEYRSRALEVINSQVIWAVKYEMACTVEDFLARRTRCQVLMQKKV